ncbi:LacI family transcriptional regulator [Vibrio sp. S4M6]|uniref:LacI family DNA-binding transcriptional regulator n=1 Tax=Vibrio sinus TaxID=2946865 RepID=UPI00202A9D7F|nr:LacI family DNA-binding transcriptional regulator [Vibrio sinus]MCL9780088.1 LacI family transcriptional regulator [Vibrio sinus]
MASLHDVARLAGVSKSTVSRVVNNEYGVKKATRVKVLKAIEECGYVVNQVAKDLKSRKTNLIGVIVPRVSSNAVAQGVDGLSKVFDSAGKHVLLTNTHQQHDKELEFIQVLNQKQVEGIVLFATHIDSKLVSAIHQSHAPVVLVGQDGSLFNIPSVIHDDIKVGFEAGNRLIDAGCKHIGFIGVQSDDRAVDGERCQGLEKALSLHGQALLFHAHGDFTMESGFQLTKNQLTMTPQLDGLFCATDRIAVGAIKALQEANIEVGKQVKVLGLGNDELAYINNPALSTFNYAFEKAGESAAKMLLELIGGEGHGMSKLVLTFDCIDRQTC